MSWTTTRTNGATGHNEVVGGGPVSGPPSAYTSAAATRKLIKFLIMFDNSNLLFFPGQFLSGRVIVEVEDDMPVLGKNSNQLPRLVLFSAL